MSAAQPSQNTTPALPRAFVFFDGQNLFHEAARMYGVTYPDFDPFRLANLVCKREGWDLRHVRFYTGVPTEQQSRRLSVFWSNKMAAMKRMKVEVVKRVLRTRDVSIKLYEDVNVCPPGWASPYEGVLFFDNGAEVPDGTILETTNLAEKGIDVRIAVDLIRFFDEGQYDVGVIFSRDMDLAEAVDEVKRLAKKHGRPVTLASVYPVDGNPPGRGVPGTLHKHISRAEYDACRDLSNYFPKS